MSNFHKQLFQNKKYIIIITVIALLLIGTLAFFLTRKGANLSLGEEQIESEKDHKLRTFYNYEVYNNKIYTLASTGDNGFSVECANGEVIFSTPDNIQSFRVLSDNVIVYVVANLHDKTNRYSSEVRAFDINKNTHEVIMSGERLSLEVAGDDLYIWDRNKHAVHFGRIGNLKKIPVSKYVNKLYSSKGKVFATTYELDKEDMISRIYLLGNEVEEVDTVYGKVSNISLDFNNTNVVYISYSGDGNETGENTYTVIKKYLKNLSTTSSGRDVYTNVIAPVYSVGNLLVGVNFEKDILHSLDNEFARTRDVASLKPNTLKSLVKESDDGKSLHFVSNSNEILNYKE